VPPTAFVRTRRHDIAGGFRGFRVALGPTIPLQYPPQEASPHEEPTKPDHYENRDLSLQRMGRHDEADADFQNAKELKNR
jgi:hypothetical protein